MNTIASLFFAIPDASLPRRQSSELVAFTQNPIFFQLAVAKQSRIKHLKAYFSGRRLKKVFLSANIAGFAFNHGDLSINFLDQGFFGAAGPAEQAQKRDLLEGAVVIINNNDVSVPHYAELYTICDKTIFIGWDWDNHHWLELSCFIAAHSDIYAPAHHENLYLLTRYNWITCGPIYCATVQWPRAFLTNNLHAIIQAERSPLPLGKHIPYTAFQFRLQVISTLNQHYSSVGFSDQTFHVRTLEDRLQEWCAHRVHWIIPVLNDIPIRIFDALVTGGIPIVPESLRLLPLVSTISQNYILFYSSEDILNPYPLVARANAIFEEGGRDQIVARHRLALDNHHGDNRIRQMLGYVSEIFGLAIS